MTVLAGCVNTKFRTNDPLFGFVVADEPRAATVARDILKQGGSAGDAAAAMAMIMTATLPSRVGLGGGGMCVLFNATTKQPRTLDFLPRAGASGTTAVPGFLRGVYALHGLAGGLRWEQIVAQAEQAAVRNTSVSRAFAQDLAAHGGRLDAEARRVFMPDGKAPAEGGALVQTDYAATLSQIRRSGVTPLYGGPLTATFAQGLGIDAAALRGFQPQWRGTVSVPRYPYDLHFADVPEAGGGKDLAAAWKAAEDAPVTERTGRALRALGAGPGSEAAGAGFTVIDGFDNAVSCVFTLGAPFGTGKMVPGTGVLGAMPVRSAGFGAPALLSNSIVGRTIFGGAGVAAGNDGTVAGPAALLAAALPALIDEAKAADIHAARPMTMPGRVSLVTCQLNKENLSKVCQAAGDPRTPGLSYVIETERPL